ncbi:hypothetical protein [Pedobacter frigoris]|uniref:hypothetical protein n=1 Tax=Pedobacter frigoris TaxID=2571272 RepID=UPI00292F0CDA|nr:hypothetical protein [Pedobacter frigoris]
MKRLYYIAFVVCLLQFLMFVLMPFGGIKTFWEVSKTGIFNNPPNPTPLFHIVSRILTYVYLGCMVCGLLTPLVYKIDPKLKYKLGVIFGSISLFILFLGGRTLMLIFG